MKAVICVLLIGTGLSLHAQNWKAGGSGEWTNEASWTTGALPGTDSTVTFTGGGPALVNIGSPQTIQGMTFNNAAQAFTFSGQTLTVTGAATGTAINNNVSPSVQTFNNAVTLNNAYAVMTINGGSAGLVFKNTFTSSNTNVLQVNGTVTFTSNVNITGTFRTSGNITFANTTSNNINSFALNGDAVVTVNTTAGVLFYGGTQFLHNQDGATLIFNTADVIGHNTRITIGNSGRTNTTYVFNANQQLGDINITNNTLNIVLGDDLTSLIFNTNSAGNVIHAEGLVIINNFKAGVINGFSADDLDRIIAYDKNGLVTLSLDGGMLVPEPATIGLLAISAGALMLMRRRLSR